MSFPLKDYILDCNTYLFEAESFYRFIVENPGVALEEFLDQFAIGEPILALDTISFLKNLSLIDIKLWKLNAIPIEPNTSFRLTIWKKLHELFDKKVENGIIFKILYYLHRENRPIIFGPRKLAEEVNMRLIQRPGEREVNKEKITYWIRLMENLGGLLPFHEVTEKKRAVFLVEYSSDLIFEMLQMLPKQKYSFERVLEWIEKFIPCRRTDFEPSMGFWKAILSLHSLKLIQCSLEADKGTPYRFPPLGRVNSIQVVDKNV